MKFEVTMVIDEDPVAGSAGVGVDEADDHRCRLPIDLLMAAPSPVLNRLARLPVLVARVARTGRGIRQTKRFSAEKVVDQLTTAARRPGDYGPPTAASRIRGDRPRYGLDYSSGALDRRADQSVWTLPRWPLGGVGGL